MKTFTDNAGRTWTVNVNVDAVKRVRSLCDVDLMDAVTDGGKLLERLVADPVLLCDVVFSICKEEADAKGISDVAFGRAMAGDPIEHATTALLEELVDFFPEKQRTVFRTVVGKLWKYRDKAVEVATLKLDDPGLDERVEQAIEDAFDLGELFPAAPESSG